MKSDARVRYTKMVIRNSFIELLQKKPLPKISVTEICQKAEINRATFYRYYMDPFDLMDQLEEQCIQEVQDKVRESRQQGIYETILIMLETISNNGLMYQVLFSANGNPDFPEKIFAACFSSLDLEADETLKNLSPQKQEWLYYYIATGCSGVLSRWMAHGMRDSREDVAGFIALLTRNTISSLKG